VKDRPSLLADDDLERILLAILQHLDAVWKNASSLVGVGAEQRAGVPQGHPPDGAEGA